MKKRFDNHSWRYEKYKRIEDAAKLFDNKGVITQIKVIGEAHNFKYGGDLRPFHFGLKTIGVEWVNNFDIYEKYQDELIYPRKIEIMEPVVIEFENGESIELMAMDNDILIAENSIEKDIIDGINDSNFECEKLFKDVVGKSITGVTSSRKKAKKFDGDFNPTRYKYKIHIVWLSNGQGLFFIGTWDASFYFGLLDRYDDKAQIRKINMTSLRTIKGVLSEQENITIVPGHDGSSYFWIMSVKPVETSEESANPYRRVAEYRPEEISIEEDDVSKYLYKYLEEYYQEDIQAWGRDEWTGNSFKWNLEYNIYSLEQIRQMIEQIKKDLSDMVIKSSDDKSAVSFYERFIWRMELMLEHCPSEYGHISFMGP